MKDSLGLAFMSFTNCSRISEMFGRVDNKSSYKCLDYCGFEMFSRNLVNIVFESNHGTAIYLSQAMGLP